MLRAYKVYYTHLTELSWTNQIQMNEGGPADSNRALPNTSLLILANPNLFLCPCFLVLGEVLVSHRPGRVFYGFGGYRWYHPTWRRQQLQPPNFPHSLRLLQFHSHLLALSAVSPSFLSFLFLSAPVTPMSFMSVAMEAAGKPLHPTSTAQI